MPLSTAKAEPKCVSIKEPKCVSIKGLDANKTSRLYTAMTKNGGYVIVFRHAQKGGNAPEWWDCEEREKSLTEDGQKQAREIGAAFDKLKIPVGEVRASPYCRTLETAYFAFGRAIRDIRLLPDSPDKLVQIVCTELDRLKNTRNNTVLVTHSQKLTGVAASLCEKGCGEAAVFEAKDGKPSCVAWILWNQWDELKR